MRAGPTGVGICCVALAVAACGGASEGVRIDGVAAHVNEHAITIADVMMVLEPIRRQLAEVYEGVELQERLDTAYDDALQSLIERRLILDAYEETEGRIPEWAVDQRVEDIVEQMFKGDRAVLMDALSREHLTFEQWRQTIREQIIVSSMRRANVEEQVAVAPGAVRAYYEEQRAQFAQPAKTRLRLILLTKGQADAEARRREAADIARRAKAGEDFGMLARTFSEGSRAADGGDWGWIDPEEELRPELAGAVAALKTGEVSDVVETEDGLYLIQVEARKVEATAPFEQVQPEIERRLRKEEAARLHKAWIGRLREKAYVKVFEPALSE